MIDVRDLRIGSIVKSPNVKWGKVNKIVEHYGDWAIGVDNDRKTNCLYTITNPNDGSALIKGIPITPKWLEKLGFKLKDDSYEIKAKGAIHSIHFGFGNPQYRLCSMINASRLVMNVRYVHELQTLIYALTKQELSLGGGK